MGGCNEQQAFNLRACQLRNAAGLLVAPARVHAMLGPASGQSGRVRCSLCELSPADGRLESWNANGRTASGAVGVAAGAGTAIAGTTAATAVGGYAGLAAASATIVLIPFAILGGAWGMARMKRAQKEKAIKTALEGRLQENGYEVADWAKAVKKPANPPRGRPLSSGLPEALRPLRVFTIVPQDNVS